MKKFLALALCAIMTLSLVSCSSSKNSNASGSANSSSQAAQSGKKLKVGFIFMNLNDSSLTAIKEDAQAECKAQNVDFSVVDGAGDSATQISAIENMITNHMDAIIIQAIDAAAVSPYLQKAMDAGIKVLAFGIETKAYTAWYRNDNEKVGAAIGKAAGDWINKNLGGKANVAVLNYPTVPQLITRSNSAVETLKKTVPNCKIVSTSAALDTETALNKTENILQKNPDVNVVISLSDGAGLGAAQALKAAKKDPSKCAVFGSDISKIGAQAILSGGFYKGSVDVDSLTLGKNAIDICLKMIKGQSVEKQVIMNTVPVDASNASKYVK